MSTQTKCTITLCCLFLVEILPLPFTAMLSLFAIRRRPQWVLNVVNRLYMDKPVEEDVACEEDALVTRKKCTRTLIMMTLIDLGPVPVTIPVALYVVRRRPKWFRNVVSRLYSDASTEQEASMGRADEVKDRSEVPEALRQRYLDLERNNRNFVLATGRSSHALDRESIARVLKHQPEKRA